MSGDLNGKNCKLIIFKQERWSSIVESLPWPLYRPVTPRTPGCGDLNKRKTNCKDHWPDVITVQIIWAKTNQKLLKDCGMSASYVPRVRFDIPSDVASEERKSFIWWLQRFSCMPKTSMPKNQNFVMPLLTNYLSCLLIIFSGKMLHWIIGMKSSCTIFS